MPKSTLTNPSADLRRISHQFEIYGEFICAEPFGNGHINDSYVATYDQGGARIRYLHQRVNHHVFKEPAALMENFWRVCEHIWHGLHTNHVPDRSRRCLTLLPTREGLYFLEEPSGDVWRTCVFIERAATYDVVESPNQAFQAAKTFGEFQRQVAGMNGGRLHETIPDFHNTPKRFAAFADAVARDPLNRAATVRDEIEFARRREPLASLLLDLHAAGEIPERITHNDTKLNNVLLDTETGEGLCVIDLDTVMPGIALYDFGDLVRSATSPGEEDERDLSKVYMQLEMFEALARGYLQGAGDALNAAEIEHLPFAGRLITYELGLRFLTDHLLGDQYFKIHRPGHNLDRTRAQFKLVESIEEQTDEATEIVERLCGESV